MAGGSARGLREAVQTIAEHFPISARSMPAASLSSRTLTTATSGRSPDHVVQRGRQRGHPGRVVGAVEDRQRVLPDHLQAARHAHPRGDLGDLRRRQRPTLRLRPPRRRPRSSCAGSRAAGRRAASGRTIRAPVCCARAPSTSASTSPSTSVADGRTTASFSRAMSATVGPSQRVCSRPTLVSTQTPASSTLVASQRPPRPASTTATSTPAAGQLVERGGGQQLELGHALAARERAVDLGGGRGGALDRGAEGLAGEVLVADPDALGEADQVRREVGAGAHAVRPRAARRSCAPSSSCRWCRRRGSPRSAPAGCRAPSAAAACAPARSACRTARARAGAPPRAARSRSQLRELLPQAGELVALGLHHGLGRLGHEALVGRACPRRWRSRPRSPCGAPRRGAARPRGRPRRRRTPPPSRPGSPRSPPARRPSRVHSSRASRATCSAVAS